MGMMFNFVERSRINEQSHFNICSETGLVSDLIKISAYAPIQTNNSMWTFHLRTHYIGFSISDTNQAKFRQEDRIRTLKGNKEKLYIYTYI